MEMARSAVHSNQDAETQKLDIFEQEMMPVADFAHNELLRFAVNRNDDGIGCGFVIDKMEISAYLKAIQRNLVPFAAFFPASSPNPFLLRVTSLGAEENDAHLLVPASKHDVYQAIKHESRAPISIHKPEHERGKVTIVAFVKQSFRNCGKGFDLIVEAPSSRLEYLELLDPKEFTDFVVPSNGLNGGSKDANAEQSQPQESEVVDESDKEDSFDIAMPKLVAVGGQESPRKKVTVRTRVSADIQILHTGVQHQATINVKEEESVEDVIERLEQSGLHTPEPENRRQSPPSQARTPVSRPVRSRRRSKKYVLDDSTEDIPDDPTFAPIRLPPRTLKKRGRPRKLNFDDCESGPETKVTKK